MSSGSGRYHSRLFNFFHQRSRQVVERCDRAFRHLKVTTKWSIEALLYPVYVLFQSMDVSKQLRSGSRQETLFPANDEDDQSPPNVDTPIEHILQAVTRPPKKLNPLDAFSRRNPLPPIRAVASQLATRTVVLVTAENEIQDILTPDQQQVLQEQILLEVAKYWHFWRLYTNKNRLSAEPTSKSLPAADRAIVLLDKIIAEIKAVPPTGMVATLQQRSWEIIKVVQTQLNLFLYGIQPDISTSTVAGDDPTTSNLKIPALIWAAVNHFFGSRDRQISPTTPKISEVRATQNTPIADPWLSSNDLFTESSAKIPPASQKIIELPEGSKYSFPNLIQWMKSKISWSPSELAQRPKSQNFLARIRKATVSLVSFTTETSSISLVTSQTGEISAPQPQATGIKHTPDWIETTAQTIGYKRHPLEQLLAWLDRLMLWVEEMFVKVWQSMQHLVRGK